MDADSLVDMLLGEIFHLSEKSASYQLLKDPCNYMKQRNSNINADNWQNPTPGQMVCSDRGLKHVRMPWTNKLDVVLQAEETKQCVHKMQTKDQPTKNIINRMLSSTQNTIWTTSAGSRHIL